jgi:hypothetical protein
MEKYQRKIKMNIQKNLEIFEDYIDCPEEDVDEKEPLSDKI